MRKSAVRTYTVTVGGREYAVARKKVRNLTLRIKKEGLCVTAPLGVSEDRVIKFITEHATWTEKHLARMQSVCGKVMLFGTAYERKDEYAPRASVEFSDGVCTVRGKDDRSRERAILDYYKKAIAHVLPPLFEKWQKATGLSVKNVTVTTAGSYLGRCETGTRLIRISCRLAAKHESVIDYVVLHEICHLRCSGHQKDFYGLVQRYMPDYKERVKLMRGR